MKCASYTVPVLPLLLALSAFVAAVIQRITGLGFVLVLTGPVVLLYGGVTGTGMSIALSLVASASALPFVWRDIEWKRVLWLLVPAALVAPLAAWIVRIVPEAALLLLVAALAILALVAGRIRGLSTLFSGRSGAITAGAGAGFLHVTAGISGPVLAAHAVGTKWPQRSFAASVQAVFVGLALLGVGFRGIPEVAGIDLLAGSIATIAGIACGTALVRFVPPHIARRGMLTFAWIGAIVVAIRGVIALFA